MSGNELWGLIIKHTSSTLHYKPHLNGMCLQIEDALKQKKCAFLPTTSCLESDSPKCKHTTWEAASGGAIFTVLVLALRYKMSAKMSGNELWGLIITTITFGHVLFEPEHYSNPDEKWGHKWQFNLRSSANLRSLRRMAAKKNYSRPNHLS